MLKKYRISVDGKSYEVEVEDAASNSTAASRPAPAAAPAAAAPAPTPSAAPAAPAPAVSAPVSSPVDVKGETLRAPMPGTILSVAASVGQNVKRGDILLVLEAMKMENEIVAHIDGSISGIFVQKGSTVNAGDILVAFA